VTEQQLLRMARRRLAILRHAEKITGNVALTCRYYGISRQCFYIWRRRYDAPLVLTGLGYDSRVQRGECSSGHKPRFLANLRQMARRAEGEDALCLVELRGFEPLTPCMPYTDLRPHHGRYGC
jgi:transposase-like protein